VRRCNSIDDIDLNIVRARRTARDIHGLQGLVACIGAKSFYVHFFTP
jgi:hypothetical protein